MTLERLERWVWMIPWGHLTFISMVVGGLVWTLNDPDGLSHADYLGAIVGASGLIAISHGIRRHREPLRSAERESSSKE
jgi:hypothetical protein